jgi:hypothetical protein
MLSIHVFDDSPTLAPQRSQIPVAIRFDPVQATIQSER